MLTKVQRGGYDIEFDSPPRLTWPLEAGKWGTGRGTWRGRINPSGFPVDVTWSVQAYEDVHVVAGTFQAFRIVLAVEGRFMSGEVNRECSRVRSTMAKP